MQISLYSASIPVLTQMLKSLSAILTKAETYATEKKIDPNALLQARLYPDMFPLIRQVQIATEFARGVSARLAGIEVPAAENNEQTFAELQAHLAKTLVFLAGFNAAQIAGQESREIVLRPGTPKERKFTGHDYLVHYGLPQFFFHVTTAYAILRHCGLEVGKKDFMGA